MNILEMYKRLSNEDKGNLTIYTIYDSIYSSARNEEIELKDEVAKNIQELSYDLYIEDDNYKLSAQEIADFITRCYSNDYKFLEKIEDISYDDILEAIDNNDYDFYKNNEMER